MQQLADQLKTLSEPTRLRIVRLLMHGELCICDLMAALDLPQSTISRHMSFLKRAGWVNGRRSTKWVYYSLAIARDPAHATLLATLKELLPPRPEAKEDDARLQQHLAAKTTAACADTAQKPCNG
ncbi:metalloregulator ArsR/SmtB family transcription factor [Desulfovibrio mangrovi]|uniref:ArsR/SmtB family transcription factor n=1 Tax=Desulfovibrio mangrovi TaxID=2976983 RepID=UPI0022487578|nr:metalloregulator ArsR/SmtB family transcription factor [Desulfovibrio mangrovi]UZP66607.1 metalloregulator ArsR/SmtB family transcription factor [Desulfovibrio mangrovi]